MIEPQESNKSKRGKGFADPAIKAKAMETRKRRLAEKKALEKRVAQKEAEKAIISGANDVPIPTELPTTLKEEAVTSDMNSLYPFEGQTEDFFHVEGKDPRFKYFHAGGNDAQKTYRRVQTLKRMGYEVVREGESSEKAFEQENRSGEMEKTTGIPGHILMRTPLELKLKRDQKKRNENQAFEEGLRDQGQFEEVNAMLKESGVGGGMRQQLEHIPQHKRLGEGLKEAVRDLAATSGRGKKYFHS